MNCTLAQIADWLRVHDNIAVLSHIRPDGDTLGSTLALVLAMKSMGKRIFPVCKDQIPAMYSFMQGADSYVTAENMPFVPECWVSVDVSTLDRVGEKELELFTNAGAKIAIDHHETNEGFGDLSYVEPHTAATGEIMLRLLKTLGAEITPDIAECLYTAISTDCGNFAFSCTTQETMTAAGECVKFGASPEKLSRLLFRMRTESTTRLLGEALSRIEMSPGKKVAMIALPDSEYKRFGCKTSDSHAFVNYLNEIEGVDVGVMLDEIPDGTKASFRGANGTDVSKLAAMFGGGGHTAAAGATLHGITLDEARKLIMDAAIKYVGE